jgi:transposase
MPQQGRIVGIDISKRKVDACIRSLQRRLSKPSTRQGEAELIAWLRENEVGLAVMEASGGYERPWAEALRKAGTASASLIPNACAISPNRPESWPRTTRSTPR